MSTVAPTQPAVSPVDPDWVPTPLYRMTLEKYEALVGSGAFSARDRFYLINGFLVAKLTQNPPHTTADELCGPALQAVIRPGWHVRSAKPIRIPSQASKPEPDRCVVRGSIRDYARRDPEPGDVALVVEIADSRLEEDRKLARLYAAAGIPVYWIVNLIDRRVEVYTDPGPAGYASRNDYLPGQHVPVVVGGQQLGMIAVDAILP
jgi:Uma2 family endonuclease